MVFAPKRTVTTLPAASSVPASALWEMAVTLPVLPPVLVAPVTFIMRPALVRALLALRRGLAYHVGDGAGGIGLLHAQIEHDGSIVGHDSAARRGLIRHGVAAPTVVQAKPAAFKAAFASAALLPTT